MIIKKSCTSNLAVYCSICLADVVFSIREKRCLLVQVLPHVLVPSSLEPVPPQAALPQVPQEALDGGRVFLLGADPLVMERGAPWPGRACPGLLLGDTGQGAMKGAEGLRGLGPLGLSWGIWPWLGCPRLCGDGLGQVLPCSGGSACPCFLLGEGAELCLWARGWGGGRGPSVPAQALLSTGAGTAHPTRWSCSSPGTVPPARSPSLTPLRCLSAFLRRLHPRHSAASSRARARKVQQCRRTEHGSPPVPGSGCCTARAGTGSRAALLPGQP